MQKRRGVSDVFRLHETGSKLYFSPEENIIKKVEWLTTVFCEKEIQFQ